MEIRFVYGWSPRPKTHLLIALLLAVVSTAVASYFAIAAYTQQQRLVHTSGLVIDSLLNRKQLHTPVIEYVDATGQRRQFVSNTSSYPQRYFVGDQVDLTIDPLTGERTVGFLTNNLALAGFFGLFSLIAWLGSLAVYWVRVRSLV